MNNSRTRQRYDREFRHDTIALVQSGRTVADMPRDLGISKWSLGRWINQTQTGHALSEAKILNIETAEPHELRGLVPSADELGEHQAKFSGGPGRFMDEMVGGLEVVASPALGAPRIRQVVRATGQKEAGGSFAGSLGSRDSRRGCSSGPTRMGCRIVQPGTPHHDCGLRRDRA